MRTSTDLQPENALALSTANVTPAADDTSAAVNPAEDFPHLNPRARTLVQLPLAERIRCVLGDTIIIHPRLAEILNEVAWMICEPAGFRTRGLVVHGAPGNGKTAISEILRHRYPVSTKAVAWDCTPPHCAITISLAGARTTKAVLVRMLDSLRCPIGRGSIAEQELCVHDVLRRCGCRLLILDETQDILKGREAEQFRVIEVLKHLMNQLRLPILALGTAEAADAFRIDAHMQARFKPIELPPWGAGDEFAAFLRKYEESLPLQKRSNLDNPLIVKHLVALGECVLDPMLRRIKAAAVQAMVDGTERITMDLLRTAPDRPNISVLNDARPQPKEPGP
jgi:hypothetical protein